MMVSFNALTLFSVLVSTNAIALPYKRQLDFESVKDAVIAFEQTFSVKGDVIDVQGHVEVDDDSTTITFDWDDSETQGSSLQVPSSTQDSFSSEPSSTQPIADAKVFAATSSQDVGYWQVYTTSTYIRPSFLPPLLFTSTDYSERSRCFGYFSRLIHRCFWTNQRFCL